MNMVQQAINHDGSGLDGLIDRGKMLDKTSSYLFFDQEVRDLMVELQQKLKTQ